MDQSIWKIFDQRSQLYWTLIWIASFVSIWGKAYFFHLRLLQIVLSQFSSMNTLLFKVRIKRFKVSELTLRGDCCHVSNLCHPTLSESYINCWSGRIHRSFPVRLIAKEFWGSKSLKHLKSNRTFKTGSVTLLTANSFRVSWVMRVGM